MWLGCLVVRYQETRITKHESRNTNHETRITELESFSIDAVYFINNPIHNK